MQDYNNHAEPSREACAGKCVCGERGKGGSKGKGCVVCKKVEMKAAE